MKRESADAYARGLLAKIGKHRAFALAEECYGYSHPSTWNNIPIGPVGYDEVESYHKLTAEQKKYVRNYEYRTVDGEKASKSYVLRIKELQYKHNFWKQVLGVVRKAK